MPSIRYSFVSSGEQDVIGAFKGIENAAKSAERATRQRERSSRTATSAEEKKYKEVAKYAAQVEKEMAREAAQAEKSAKKAADAQAREAKRAGDARAAAMEHVSQIRQRYEAEQERGAKRAADVEIREAKRSAAERARAIDHVLRIREQYDRGQKAAGDRRVGAFDRSFSAVKGLGKDALFAGIGLAGAGLGVIGGAAREGMRLQDVTTRLAINARGAGEKGADATVLRKEFEAAALANPGVSAAALAEGAQGFVAKTGDLAAARRFSGTFATVASATGSDVGDIANAAADIFQKFDITSIHEMRDALAALTFQGKQGAFELRDAASQFAKISAAAERFGVMKGPQGLKVLGGLTQIARSATGSPEQAATAVEAMFRQVTAKSDKLAGMGVSVFDKGGKSRDIRDILVETISKNKGDLPKLQKVFEEEGIRAVSPLISTFNEARGGAKGTETEKTAAGVKALREALEKAINAPGDWSEVVKDAASAQQMSSAQLDAAWEKLKMQVAGEVVPVLVRLVPKLTELMGESGPLIITFKALAEAAGLAVDGLKWLGLIKDKSNPNNLTPEEKRQKLDVAEKELQAKMEKGAYVPTAAELGNIEKMRGELFTTSDTARGERMRSMSPEAFAQRYAELGGASTPEDRAAAVTGARGLANKIAGGTASAYIEKNDFLQSMLGENAAQQALRNQFQGDVAFDRDGGKGAATGVDTSKLQAQVDGLTEKLGTLGKAVAVAAEAKQASVFNGR